MGARDLLAELAGAGLSVRAEGERLVVRPASKLTDDMRAALVGAKPELLALLAGNAKAHPYKLTKAEGDAAHAEPWDDAACGRFVARVSLFLRRGIDANDADDLAELMHLRDVQGDDRRLCVECRNVAGNAGSAGSGWTCRASRKAEVGRDLPAELATGLHRCPAFEEAALA